LARDSQTTLNTKMTFYEKKLS